MGKETRYIMRADREQCKFMREAPHLGHMAIVALAVHEVRSQGQQRDANAQPDAQPEPQGLAAAPGAPAINRRRASAVLTWEEV